MADILTAADIAGIQRDIAPATGDDLVHTGEIWRDPDTNTLSASNTDAYGAPVDTGTAGRRKVAQYPCRLGQAGMGQERPFGAEQTPVAPWVVTFNAADNPDVRGSDQIRMTVAGVPRVFEVVDPGGVGTFNVLRTVGCTEVEA